MLNQKEKELQDMEKVKVVLVGLGFGGAFAQIYKKHPDVSEVGIYDTNQELMLQTAKKLGIGCVYGSFEEILRDTSVDAVHLVTPIPLHEEQTVRVLESGKHCACTVPMAISLEGIQRIMEAVRRTGKKYMMMETTLYTYQFFYAQQMIREGKIGKIQFLRGSHYQDMANWPDYWMGLPPMYYGTHAISPMRVLAGSRIKRVTGFGSGSMQEEYQKKYGNPYPLECAVLEFENGLKGEATRSLFEVARTYQEGFFVYGDKGSFEWGFADGDKPYMETAIPAVVGKRGGEAKVEQIDLPNYYQMLPESIAEFTVGSNFDPLNPQNSLVKGAGGGHHGSHPHLVHEFVRSIVEDRKPWIDEELGGNITAAGICAHLSAMEGSKAMEVPDTVLP